MKFSEVIKEKVSNLLFVEESKVYTEQFNNYCLDLLNACGKQDNKKLDHVASIALHLARADDGTTFIREERKISPKTNVGQLELLRERLLLLIDYYIDRIK